MLFDTDLLIWHQRGNGKAADWIDQAPQRFISILTCMELLQGAKDKNHLKLTQAFLRDLGFTVLPLTPNIGTRALVYIEEYGLSTGMRAADALLAATAAEHGLVLATGNAKHYRAIKDIRMKEFRP